MGESQITFQVRNQIIARTDTFRVVAKSHDYLRASFDFLTDDWNEANAKTAIFTGVDGKAYEVLLDANGDCEVPWECIREQGYMYVSVYGGSLITVNRAKVFAMQSGYREDTENGLESTPTMAEQIMGYFDETIGTVTNNAQIAQDASEEAREILEQIQTLVVNLGEYETRTREYMEAALEYKNLAKEYLDEIEALMVEARGIRDTVTQTGEQVQVNADAVAAAVTQAQAIAEQVAQTKDYIDACKTEIEGQLEEANEIRMVYGNGGTYDDWKN